MSLLRETVTPSYTVSSAVTQQLHVRRCDSSRYTESRIINFFLFFLLALQPPSGVVFYSPLAGFSLLAYEVS